MTRSNLGLTRVEAIGVTIAVVAWMVGMMAVMG